MHKLAPKVARHFYEFANHELQGSREQKCLHLQCFSLVQQNFLLTLKNKDKLIPPSGKTV